MKSLGCSSGILPHNLEKITYCFNSKPHRKARWTEYNYIFSQDIEDNCLLLKKYIMLSLIAVSREDLVFFSSATWISNIFIIFSSVLYTFGKGNF